MRQLIAVVGIVVLLFGQTMGIASAKTSVAEKAYLGIVGKITEESGNDMAELVSLTGEIGSNPYLAQDPTYVAAVSIIFGRFQGYAVVLKDLEPPDDFDDLHDELIAGFSDLDKCGDALVPGMIALDPTLVQIAVEYMNSAGEHFGLAADLMDR